MQIPGTKYRHRFLVSTGPAEGVQLANEFHVYGERDIDGENYVGLIQTGQADPSPTWFRETTFNEMFDLLT